MSTKKEVTNPGEAIGVLIQVAELAQKSGILSFDDATITKSAIDFLISLNQTKSTEFSEISEGPK